MPTATLPDDRSASLLVLLADLSLVRTLVDERTSAAYRGPQTEDTTPRATWQALGFVLQAIARAINTDLGFTLTPPCPWSPPPAHVLTMLADLADAQYRAALSAHALPLMVVAPWDRVRWVLTHLQTSAGALNLDDLIRRD
jgi:hypothetical protein